MNFTGAADSRLTFEMHARVNHCVGTDLHVGVDICGGRIFNRDPGSHQLFVLRLSHDAAYLCQLGAAIDAAHLVGVFERHRFHDPPLAAVGPDQIRKIVLPLSVFRSEPP